MPDASNPFAAPAATPSGSAASPAPKVAFLKAWFLFTLISTVLGFLVGAVSGVILGGVLGAAGYPPQQVGLICALVGFVLGLPISFLTFRWAVQTFIVSKLPA